MQIFTILCLHLISQKLNWPLKTEIVIMLLNSAKTSNYAVKVSNLLHLINYAYLVLRAGPRISLDIQMERSTIY